MMPILLPFGPWMLVALLVCTLLGAGLGIWVLRREPAPSEPAEKPPAASILLGGRAWRILQSGTLEHAVWIDRLLLESHLRAVRLQPGETAEQFASRLLDALTVSGKSLDLLAGLLVPGELRDEEWSPEVAAATARFLQKLSGPQDLAAARALLVTAVLGFFEGGLGSIARSGIASPAPLPPPVRQPRTTKPC